jgi:small conductance mechanosensitive channel
LPGLAQDALAHPIVDAGQKAQTALREYPLVWGKLVDLAGSLAINLTMALLILTATFWAATWAGRLVRKAIGRLHVHNGPDTTLQAFGSSVARYAVGITGLIAVLQQLGVKTTSIIAVLGAASLAIGLALQGALSNVAAGVMILLFRPYRVGDLVESLGRTGQVRALDLFVTEFETLDGLRIMVPNSKIFGDVIINHSFHPRRRADVLFHVPLAADIQALMARLRERLAADPRVMKTPSPIVEVTGMAEAWVEVASRPWVNSKDYGPVKADQLLCARLLEADPTAALPPRAGTPDLRDRRGGDQDRAELVEPPW